ncbi:MAG: preprotein translocase subunit SecA, partial [Spirochaetes bacterium]|nr:preprotein translocase subunit SecA [Spirochaetota bacterium]
MFFNLFASKKQRDAAELKPWVAKVNRFEEAIHPLSDEALKAKTAEFKAQLAGGKNIWDVLPEAFAVVREASMRTLKMRHFDVQLMGGITLFEGKIAEMKTGEGKTLVATLAAYLRALEGKGVHVITVNDYLAKRDAHWMGPIYQFLGLTVGWITHEVPPQSETRRAMYACDITYGTNNEFGFDYLRDNMVTQREHKVQRGHHYAIVDEVDSILIDEARTPLIISGPSELDTTKYYEIDKIIPRLRQAQTDEQKKEIPGTGDYTIDLKDKSITITEDGVHKIEGLLSIDNLYSPQNVEYLHHVQQALRAHKIMANDVDYIIEGGEIVIIDEFTGRKMEGRRYSDGLHQAIEAKERVQIVSETQTLASITFQNYFRMYTTMAGMTGTADTEAMEFKKIYKLDVVVMPPNQPMVRIDEADRVYRTEAEKFEAVAKRVEEAQKAGVPVLVGTASVDKSEVLSRIFTRKALRHEVLNAKNHEREAHIIENAGQSGSITIATNMAGRGTDIKLGPGVKERGGLLIVGSERHEARRVDNQLRGRSGRQGDPGKSVFFLSLEDDLMKRFGSERISNIMLRLGMQEGEEIQHPLVSRAIANAQKKVENRNFDIRKHLLEYDDVMNQQRQIVYKERDFLLYEDDALPKILELIDEVVAAQLWSMAGEAERVHENLWDDTAAWVKGSLGLALDLDKERFNEMKFEAIEEHCILLAQNAYKAKRASWPSEAVMAVERQILLYNLDNRWKEHLLAMDHLREGISLRSYAERKPLNEFKREGFRLFDAMLHNFRFEVVETLFRARLVEEPLPTRSVMQPTQER